MSNWNIDDEPYPGPDREPVGWAYINGEKHPVYHFSFSSISSVENVTTLAQPRTLASGDTLQFTTVTSITT